MKKAMEFADEYDRGLKATDKRLNRCALVVCDDGSRFFVQSAFLVRKGDFIIMIAEHYQTHVFHEDDVQYCAQFGEAFEIEEVGI